MDDVKISAVNVEIHECTIAGMLYETDVLQESVAGPVGILPDNILTKESLKFKDNKIDAQIECCD